MLLIVGIVSLVYLSWVRFLVIPYEIIHILVGPKLKPTLKLLWNNVVKSLLVDLWFERNQRVFHDRKTPWLDRFETARLNTSSWCILSKSFEDFSIQDLCLNWPAFIFPTQWFPARDFNIIYFIFLLLLCIRFFWLCILFSFCSALFWPSVFRVLGCCCWLILYLWTFLALIGCSSFVLDMEMMRVLGMST